MSEDALICTRCGEIIHSKYSDYKVTRSNCMTTDGNCMYPDRNYVSTECPHCGMEVEIKLQ